MTHTTPIALDGPVSVIQVIKIEGILTGKGIPENPSRRVTQYWTMDGKLIVEIDPWLESQRMVVR